jgi:DNA-binding beta-propeller fold protein YncE
MKRVISAFYILFSALVSMRATCGAIRPIEMKPVEVVRIPDNVYFHNVSITHNGSHYFTINGGNDRYCTLNEYDNEGNLIGTYDVGLDARSICFNPSDKRLYVKTYGSDLYIADLDTESAEVALRGVFDADNSSVGMTTDGKRVYELAEGLVKVLDFRTGKELKRFTLTSHFDEHGFNSSIAVSNKYIFLWGDTDAIIVYDLNGLYVTEFGLPRSGYGLSLSYCNNMLWIAQDADASTDRSNGYWYGYRL